MADDTYTVERTLTVDAPPERLYGVLSDFHDWPSWSPWEDLDPELKRSHSGAEAGKGAVYRWSGNRRVGQGQMEITEAVEPSEVHIGLRFEKPWKAQNDTQFTIQPEGSGSRVTWSMTGKHSLMTKVMGVFKSMDKMVGPDFEKGLARLKANTEQPTAG